jgi:hypothetical protein
VARRPPPCRASPLISPPLQQGLTADGARALARCLEAHPALESLTLSRNSLGAAGAAALCVPWRALRRLDLASCGLDAAAAAALADAPALGTLTHLSLSGNDLGPAGGAALAKLLARATRLEALELRDTRLEPEGERGGAAWSQAHVGRARLPGAPRARRPPIPHTPLLQAPPRSRPPCRAPPPSWTSTSAAAAWAPPAQRRSRARCAQAAG